MADVPKDGLKLTVKMDARSMRRYGLGLQVKISPVTGAGFEGPWHEVKALIDTGANRSCISVGLADRLGADPTGNTMQHVAGGKPQRIPVFRCKIKFSNDVEVAANFGTLTSLAPPYDALIGLDLLSSCRLWIDFVAGYYEIHFPTPPD